MVKLKKIIKFAVYCLIYLLVLPSGLSARLLHLIFKSQVLYHLFAQFYSLFPGIIGTVTRSCYYKQTLSQSYFDLDIGFGSYISKIETSIGRNVLITGGTSLGNVKVGDRAVIANHVSILSGKYQHNFTDPNKPILSQTNKFEQLNIGEDTFIGDRSVVMADVGSKSIVGAGSIVIKDIPDNVVAAGNPARVLKSRIADPQDNLTTDKQPSV